MYMKTVSFFGRKIMCFIYYPVHHDYCLLNTCLVSKVYTDSENFHKVAMIFKLHFTITVLVEETKTNGGSQDLEMLNNLVKSKDLGSGKGRVGPVCLLTRCVVSASEVDCFHCTPDGAH